MDSINQSILGLEDSYNRNEIKWKVKNNIIFYGERFKGETTSHLNI